MAIIRPDDLKAGMFVTVADEEQPDPWDVDAQMVAYHTRDARPEPGMPMMIKAMNIPFLACVGPTGDCNCGRRHAPNTFVIDTRVVKLMKVSRKYAMAFDDDDEMEHLGWLEDCTKSHQFMVAEMRAIFGIAEHMPVDVLVNRIKAKVAELKTSGRLILP